MTERVADLFYRSSLSDAQSYSATIEELLSQLILFGFPEVDISYRNLPHQGQEEVLCRGVRVCVVARVYGTQEIGTSCQLYPDGRPEGWPELRFKHGLLVSSVTGPVGPPRAPSITAGYPTVTGEERGS
jgi:hypothetical protein